MPADNLFFLLRIVVENSILAYFLFHRMNLRKPLSKRISFLLFVLFTSSVIYLSSLVKIDLAMHQIVNFLIWLFWECLFFGDSFSNKAFHSCLLCFIDLFADQLCNIIYLFFFSVYSPFPELYNRANVIWKYPFFSFHALELRSVGYLILEFLIMLIFLFVLNKIPYLSEKLLGFLVAVTAAALILSTYFLSDILFINSPMPTKQRLQFYVLCILILMLFLSTLLLHQITGRIFTQNMDLAEKLHEREKIEERNQALLQSAQNLHKWKHDYTNHLIAMNGLLKQQDYYKLQQYIEKQMENLPLSFPSIDTGHPVIDAILTNKYATAQMYQISFQYSVILPALIPLNDIELTGICGNLLDNALEACRKEAVTSPYIEFTIKPKRDMLHIRVKNSSSGNYNYDNHGNFKTTKEEKEIHGKGLKNIISITESHAGFYNIHAEPAHFLINIFIPL